MRNTLPKQYPQFTNHYERSIKNPVSLMNSNNNYCIPSNYEQNIGNDTYQKYHHHYPHQKQNKKYDLPMLRSDSMFYKNQRVVIKEQQIKGSSKMNGESIEQDRVMLSSQMNFLNNLSDKKIRKIEEMEISGISARTPSYKQRQIKQSRITIYPGQKRNNQENINTLNSNVIQQSGQFIEIATFRPKYTTQDNSNDQYLDNHRSYWMKKQIKSCIKDKIANSCYDKPIQQQLQVKQKVKTNRRLSHNVKNQKLLSSNCMTKYQKLLELHYGLTPKLQRSNSFQKFSQYSIKNKQINSDQKHPRNKSQLNKCSSEKKYSIINQSNSNSLRNKQKQRNGVLNKIIDKKLQYKKRICLL